MMTPNNTVTPTTEFDFDKQIYWLLKSEPFFAALSRHVDKRASDSCPTAGVRVTDEGRYEMVYNQKFFEGLTQEQRRGVLKHEFYHLIFEHVTTRKPEDPLLFKRWNIATDLAINSHIPREELPDNGCIPGEGPFEKYPEKQTGEWYFAKLNNEDDGGEGQEPMDDHDGWGEGEIDPSVKEIAKQRLKEMMKDAAEEANKKSWGSVSADMRADIMKRIGGKIDWRAVLRYFIKTSKRAEKSSTVKRLNKRFPYIHAGKKVRRHANIAISIDQSGSVGDDLLEKFFTELNKLADIATFTVVPFDTEVDAKLVYEWKKGTKHKTERVKCGGTDFDAPTKFVNGKKFDGHIILTDMYAPKPVASACQRMWMTNEEGAKNPYFKTTERVISVD
jgi:predicted metal-dependent peptidase